MGAERSQPCSQTNLSEKKHVFQVAAPEAVGWGLVGQLGERACPEPITVSDWPGLGHTPACMYTHAHTHTHILLSCRLMSLGAHAHPSDPCGCRWLGLCVLYHAAVVVALTGWAWGTHPPCHAHGRGVQIVLCVSVHSSPGGGSAHTPHISVQGQADVHISVEEQSPRDRATGCSEAG